ncbi:MAG: hypothetical protein QOJ58_5256 [Alphaproteobacteria bacterium]|nr:hypothetical protein [Alphaproteobacteria bacterium]
MINIDLARMTPVPRGSHRGLLTGQPNYIGGRLDGQLAPAEFQPFRRSSSGQPLADDQQPPKDHYLLFVVNGGYLFHYVHTTLLPADYLPQTGG